MSFHRYIQFGNHHSVKVLVAQSCPTLSDPMDCSLPGLSVHGILQERILDAWDKRSDLVLWEDLEGAGGEGGGRGDRHGEDMWTQGLFISMYDKIHYKKKKNTGVGSHSLLQGIFPIQGSKPGLLHCRQILNHLSPQESLQCC